MNRRYSFWLITFLLVLIAILLLWRTFTGVDLPDVSLTGFAPETDRAR